MCEAPGSVGNTKTAKFATKRLGAIAGMMERDHGKTHTWRSEDVPVLPEMRKIMCVHPTPDKPGNNRDIVVIRQSHVFTGYLKRLEKSIACV